MSPSKSVKFEVASVRLGVKLDYIVPIIDFAEFALLLQKSGYTFNQVPTSPMNFIGTRGAVEIYIDGMRGVFGVTSKSIDGVMAIVDEVFTATSEAFDFDLKEYVSFFEFEINANYNIHKDVYGIMAKLFQDSSDMKTINDVLKGQYSQISLKLTPSAKNINNPEWYDLTIEPKVNSTGNTFHVRILCRSPKLRDVVDNIKGAEKKVTSIIRKVLTK